MPNIVYRVKKAILPIMLAAVLIATQPLAAVHASTEPTQAATESTSSTTAEVNQPVAPAPTTTTTAPPVSQTPEIPTSTPKTTAKKPASPSKPATGPDKPTGDAGSKYTQNKETGLWENDKYSWDPSTGKTAPKQETKYSYNPASGKWETTDWRYDAPSGKYVPNVVSSLSAPSELSPEEKAQVMATTKSSNPDQSDENELNSSNKSAKDSAETNSENKGFFDNFFNASISNTIGSSAVSGDASVSGNTAGGSAATGDAAAIANVINMLQSSWGWTSDIMTFMADIYGNVVGDITLDPGQASSTANRSGSDLDVDVNVENNATINNDIDLKAKSGDADVTKNTKAGDATSGDATAIANIINLINSSISAGDSFLGMVNIHGNLDGDILLPPTMIDQIKALSIGKTGGNIAANSETSQTINNNVDQNSTSGNASVTQNTKAGSATTGSATNDLSIINLTGRQIVGDNALLVFVNVFGEWVGMIVDAPAGSTSAALGNGITENSQLPANGGDITLDEKNNHEINNDISVDAQTGNALVGQNTEAGDATSGDAQTAVNVTNISNSQLALTKWFGVLFINVFGFWNGSFGVDTDAGNKPTPVVTPRASSSGSNPSAGAAHGHVSPELLNLVSGGGFSAPNASRAATVASVATDSTTVKQQDDDSKKEDLAAVANVSDGSNHSENSAAGSIAAAPSSGGGNSSWLLSALGIALGVSLLGTERFLSLRESRRKLQHAA